MEVPRGKLLILMFSAFLLSGIVVLTVGSVYPESYLWSFPNNNYFRFNQPVNLAQTPFFGVPHDSNLIGYWNMNEGSGIILHDSSGNGNNGVITGASWVDGKYGKALRFNGIADYVLTSFNSIFGFGKEPFSFGGWVTFENQYLAKK